MVAALIPVIAAVPLVIIIIWVWPHARDYLRACRTPEHEDR